MTKIGIALVFSLITSFAHAQMTVKITENYVSMKDTVAEIIFTKTNIYFSENLSDSLSQSDFLKRASEVDSDLLIFQVTKNILTDVANELSFLREKNLFYEEKFGKYKKVNNIWIKE